MPSQKYFTDNGVEITDGLRVFTTDWCWGNVKFAQTPLIDSEYFNGWFAVELDGGPCKNYDGSRMSTVKPS